MKFTLRHLGRLEEATIDLGKDLIVLTGPNNTSKTYVAHAIYGFCRKLVPILSADLIKHLEPLVSAQAELTLKVNLIELLDAHLPALLSDLGAQYHQQLASIFAAGEDFVARTTVVSEVDPDRVANGERALLALKSGSEPSDFSITALQKEAGHTAWVFAPRTGHLRATDSAEENAILKRIFVAEVATQLALQIAVFILGVSTTSYILTAERAAIQLFSRELSMNRTALVDNLLSERSDPRRGVSAEALLGTLDKRAQRYPLGIRTSLQIANDLATLRKITSPFASLADRLERDLLGGAIRVSEDGDMLFHPDPAGPGLTLHLSSSSVKSVAALSFFLRHIAQRNQLLIIDEPELNLHPDNQRRVARVLARLARAGVKVLISTHSDYVIRELNNLIMLSADQDGELRRRHGYDEEETLRPEQVGAYLFDPSRARPIEVTPTGIEVETIDREINALNTVSQDIYFSLFGKTAT
ncbi:MAG TPA: AAA family ATPase [Candidatus Nanopelagicales bacterium]|nr:AAA family ATPase [Candidatus Nanopelagicales bacterium]